MAGCGFVVVGDEDDIVIVVVVFDVGSIGGGDGEELVVNSGTYCCKCDGVGSSGLDSLPCDGEEG